MKQYLTPAWLTSADALAHLSPWARRPLVVMRGRTIQTPETVDDAPLRAPLIGQTIRVVLPARFREAAHG